MLTAWLQENCFDFLRTLLFIYSAAYKPLALVCPSRRERKVSEFSTAENTDINDPVIATTPVRLKYTLPSPLYFRQ